MLRYWIHWSSKRSRSTWMPHEGARATSLFYLDSGLLQNLLKHELLICALRNAEPMSFHVDSFATSPAEPAPFSDMFRQDMSVVRTSSKPGRQLLPARVCETGNGSAFSGSTLARELSG